MSKERKKIKKEDIPIIEPKKREGYIPEIEVETQKQVKQKNIDDKYVKISIDAKNEEFKILGDRTSKGEIKWSYYTIENEKGFHYYQILKN